MFFTLKKGTRTLNSHFNQFQFSKILLIYTFCNVYAHTIFSFSSNFPTAIPQIFASVSSTLVILATNAEAVEVVVFVLMVVVVVVVACNY